jgi:hypothetical protein
VAYYGAARTQQLGILGIGPEAAAKQLVKQAAAYDRASRPVLPAFELIGSLATRSPGEDGLYRVRMSDSLVGGYLDTARRYKMLFVIDVQPGRADFLPSEGVEKYLRDPDVGLALDPEWHVSGDQVPAAGSSDPRRRRRSTRWGTGWRRWCGSTTSRRSCSSSISSRPTCRAPGSGQSWPELATVFEWTVREPRDQDPEVESADANEGPTHHYHGFKLFYDWDSDLMSPRAVMPSSRRST